MSQGRRRTRDRKRSGPNRGKGAKAQAAGVDRVAFWGDESSLPDPIDPLTTPADVTALMKSLGRPPLSGHETAAEHWFSLVYERSAVLAGALAAATNYRDERDPATE